MNVSKTINITSQYNGMNSEARNRIYRQNNETNGDRDRDGEKQNTLQQHQRRIKQQNWHKLQSGNGNNDDEDDGDDSRCCRQQPTMTFKLLENNFVEIFSEFIHFRLEKFLIVEFLIYLGWRYTKNFDFTGCVAMHRTNICVRASMFTQFQRCDKVLLPNFPPSSNGL